MNIKELKEKNKHELNELLVTLYRQKLKLLIEKTDNADFKKGIFLRNVKKDIARILTLLTSKKGFEK